MIVAATTGAETIAAVTTGAEMIAGAETAIAVTRLPPVSTLPRRRHPRLTRTLPHAACLSARRANRSSKSRKSSRKSTSCRARPAAVPRDSCPPSARPRSHNWKPRQNFGGTTTRSFSTPARVLQNRSRNRSLTAPHRKQQNSLKPNLKQQQHATSPAICAAKRHRSAARLHHAGYCCSATTHEPLTASRK